MKKNGKLFGIGVGPGDPELLTLKAVRLIQQADVIFTAASSKNAYSLAVKIAEPHISEKAELISLSFPMTKDRKETQAAWKNNAELIAKVLRQGRHAAFLTLGDPTTYSTFGYILKNLEQVMPEADIETVPGITSFHAAAARLNRILVEGEESLLITSGAYGGESLENISKNIQKLVMMKAYKNTAQINAVLKKNNFYNNSVAISQCGRQGEEIIEDIDDLEKRKPDYWTLILAGK